MEDLLFADAARQLLSDRCTPAEVRAIEAGGAPGPLWSALEQSGFPDALVPEDDGGAGLTLAQVGEVWSLCGAFALPLPLPQTMLARALLARAGLPRPDGPIALAEGRWDADGALRCASVGFGQVTAALAGSVLVSVQGQWCLLPASEAGVAPAPFPLDAALRWPMSALAGSASLPITLPDGLGLRELEAVAVAALIAGALREVFRRTLDYANEREQFGRPIGKFQAIQHQLAVMSEHVFAARMAAQLGMAGTVDSAGDGAAGLFPTPLRAAVAKARCSQAALAGAETAHAVFGAIGITAEHDLQLFTRRLHAWRRQAGSESHWHAVAGAALVDGHGGSTLDLLRETTDIA